ncbi:helix-turn-helix domain-containing protein [Microbacterium sp. NPDC057407]|uniref:helix-turn-helix domain-containing protein n=1 Tax=Microbacterium sp. NPDC057407 TaxID=3346120 RepID=UPI00367350BE
MSTLDHTAIQSLSHTFVTPAQVVAMLPGITLRTLAMWRYRQVGPPYRKLGARIVYPLDELDDWVESQAHGSDARR